MNIKPPLSLALESPDMPVSLSSDVLPEIMEYERTATTIANSYVKPCHQEVSGECGGKTQRYGCQGFCGVMVGFRPRALRKKIVQVCCIR